MTLAEKYAAQNEELLSAVKCAIRWHYYDDFRGQQSLDPGQNGIDSNILRALESCLVPFVVERLRKEGKWWAEMENDASVEQGGRYVELEWHEIAEKFR